MAASRVLIYGGKGALGMTCVTYFKARNWVSNPVAFSNYCVVVGYTAIIFVYSSSCFHSRSLFIISVMIDLRFV